MTDAERDQYEKEIAAAILLLWILFDSEWRLSGAVDYLKFKAAFDEKVKPTLSRVYGSERYELGRRHGVNYVSRPSAEGASNIITIPNMDRAINTYADDLYQSFQRRVTPEALPPVARQAGGTAVEEPPVATEPEYTEEDASRWSVTNVTSASTQGQQDAATDVEATVGTRLVGYWRTEPGACPRCAALEGHPERVWRVVAPNGPGLHPNCRCSLVWRPLIQ